MMCDPEARVDSFVDVEVEREQERRQFRLAAAIADRLRVYGLMPVRTPQPRNSTPIIRRNGMF